MYFLSSPLWLWLDITPLQYHFIKPRTITACFHSSQLSFSSVSVQFQFSFGSASVQLHYGPYYLSSSLWLWLDLTPLQYHFVKLSTDHSLLPKLSACAVGLRPIALITACFHSSRLNGLSLASLRSTFPFFIPLTVLWPHANIYIYIYIPSTASLSQAVISACYNSSQFDAVDPNTALILTELSSTPYLSSTYHHSHKVDALQPLRPWRPLEALTKALPKYSNSLFLRWKRARIQQKAPPSIQPFSLAGSANGMDSKPRYIAPLTGEDGGT